MADMNVPQIDVYINSPGGSVFAGMAIYSALKRHQAHINVQIDGVAASIASVIALAGDTVSISEVGMFMIHSPWSAVMGNATEMRKQADVLDKVEESMISAYARANIDEKKLKSMLAEETWLTAKEAVAYGFADEVIGAMDIAAAIIPKDRFKNTPDKLLAKEKAPLKPTVGASKMPDPIDMEVQLQAARDAAAEEAKAQAKADEAQRRKAIDTIFSKFTDRADLRASCMDDMDCTPAQASEKLLEELGKNAEPLGGATRIQHLASERELFRKGVINGALQRAGVIKPEDNENNPYRGFSMRDVARACVEQMGMPVAKMGTEQIIRAALTTESDFPVLYENIMHKVLLGAYRTQADTWSQFMDTGNLADFRPHNRYRMGTFGDLPVISEAAEIPRTTLQDATKEQIAAKERGMIFDLTFKSIVDDDMGGLTRIAQQMGRSARRTVENTVFDLLVSNPVMGDGNALFDAAHSNYQGSGSEISVESLGEARAAMRKQMDPSSNEYIDLLPSILLCPVELGDKARQVLASETDPGQTNSRVPNPIRNMVTVVDTPRLSGTGWYLMAAPSDTAIGEVGFLNGNSEPQMMMENLFSTRGVQWRVTLDFGVAMLEWRAGYLNDGAVAVQSASVSARRNGGKKS